ncbi:MAG: UDP-N-acetylmuramoyl-L-alanine--D-glutamate ligase [Acidimicrobiales bacterium]
MKLDELQDLRVAVWGLGTEGRAMVRLLSERGIDPVCIDDRSVEGVALGRSGPDPALAPSAPVLVPASVPWDRIDVVIRSPGVSTYRPELLAARSNRVAVTTAMAIWLDDFAGSPVIAVTGTKGKSTTAALASAICRRDGSSVELIGNIGVPVTDTYKRPSADVYVVEVSSYQAAEVSTTPRTAVLTSLAPDHLTWHGSAERYYRDKLRLIDAGPPGRIAVNGASEEALGRTARHPDRTLYGTTGRVVAGDSAWITVDGVPLVDASRLRPPGRHNLWNLCGALTGLLLHSGALPAPATVAAALQDFEGLPSRCAEVGERDGRTFVDDALASNPFATVTSMSAYEGRALTVILGGDDRGVDPADLVDALVGRIPAPSVVVLPPDPERLAGALEVAAGQAGHRRGLRVQTAPDLDVAVSLAVRSTPPGGVVLFSPAAPTPSDEGDYRERSRRFVAAAGFGGATVAKR